MGEALKPEFRAYGRQVAANAGVLAEKLIEQGFRLVSGGTDNHLILVDTRHFGLTGKEYEHRLDEVGITVNKNTIPNDPEKPFVTSGIRVGTPAVTTRGFREPEMAEIARWMGLMAKRTMRTMRSRSVRKWRSCASGSRSIRTKTTPAEAMPPRVFPFLRRGPGALPGQLSRPLRCPCPEIRHRGYKARSSKQNRRLH